MATSGQRFRSRCVGDVREPIGMYLLGAAIDFDTMLTGHVPDIDSRTATTQQAHDSMTERQPRIRPGLFSH